MVSPVAGLRPVRAARALSSRMPSPLMRIRSPRFRCVVIAVTNSASIPWACFFGRPWASPSCSNTVFNVTTGAGAAFAWGAGALAFALAVTAAAFFATDFLAEGLLAAAGRVAMGATHKWWREQTASRLYAMLRPHKPDAGATTARFRPKSAQNEGPYRIKSQRCWRHTIEPDQLRADAAQRTGNDEVLEHGVASDRPDASARI